MREESLKPVAASLPAVAAFHVFGRGRIWVFANSTEHPKVLRVLAADTELEIIPRIDELIRMVTMQTVSDAALRSAVTNLVPDFIAEAEPKDVLPIKKRDPGDIRRA